MVVKKGSEVLSGIGNLLEKRFLKGWLLRKALGKGLPTLYWKPQGFIKALI